MKKVNYIFFFLIILKGNISFGQKLQWQNTLGSSSNDLITDIEIDQAGNTYVSGHSFSTIDLNPSGSPMILGNAQSFGLSYLIKYNINKEVDWLYSIDVSSVDDYINSICIDGQGNVYITGYVGGFFNAATDPDSIHLIGSEFGCAYIIKLNNAGNLLWHKSLISQKTPNIFGQPPWPIFVNGIKIINKDNEIYFTGTYQGVTQFDPDSSIGNLNPISNNSPYNDIFICNYTTNGDFQWVFRLASQGADAPSDLAFDNAGNLLISGLQGGALDFDPSSTTTYAPPVKGTSDCFMAKYSPQGAFILANVFGGTLGSDRVNGIASDEHNNVYIAGEYRDTVDFAPTGIVVNAISTGLKDAYIAKYSPNKVLQWVKSFGNENDNEVFKSLAYAEGKLHTTGSFAHELHLNNSNLQALYSNGLNDAMVAVFDTSGIAQQSFALGSKLSDEGLIIVPNNNHVFVGGYYRDSTDFALDTAFSLATCQGGYDIFIAEYNLDELVNKVKIVTIESTGLNLFPSPNNGNFSINFTEQKISGVLEIYDLNGLLMHSEYVAPWSNTKQLNLHDKLSNGMYALRLSFGEQMAVVKFVVEK
jgi:hypothetical protein